MITIRELKKNPARDIVEGRKKLVPVEMAPLTDFKCEAAPVEEEVQFQMPGVRDSNLIRRPNGGVTLDSAMDAFRDTKPEMFTAEQAGEFISNVGWLGLHPAQSARIHLNKLASCGEVERAGRASGSTRAFVLWRFKAA